MQTRRSSASERNMIQDVNALEKIERLRAINRRLNECIASNLIETRHQSIRIWRALVMPADTLVPIIRTTFEREYDCHQQITSGSASSPWQYLPITDLESEIGFADNYRERFVKIVRGFSENELTTRQLFYRGAKTTLICLLFHLCIDEMLASEALLRLNNPSGALVKPRI